MKICKQLSEIESLNIKPIVRIHSKLSKHITTKNKTTNIVNRIYLRSNDFIIYRSKNGISGINYNFATKDENGDDICCRQISYFVMTTGFKNYHSFFANKFTISNIDILKKNVYDKLNKSNRSTYYCYVELEELGNYLHHIASFSQIDQRIGLLLTTENHALALDVQRKRSLENKSVYIIKFYDPNETTTHKRVLCDDLINLRKIKIEHLLTKSYINNYFPKFKAFLVRSPVMLAYGVEPYVECKGNDLSSQLYFCMWNGLLHEAYGCIKQIMSLGCTKLIFDKLAARSARGNPSLNVAMQMDKNQVATVLIRSIINSELRIEEKLYLLHAKNAEGNTGFGLAMLYHSKHVIDGYMDIILKSSLLDHHKVNLLKSQSENGKPCLYLAMEHGCDNSVSKYISNVLTSHLLGNDKYNLLLAKNNNGTPGLYSSMQYGHKETSLCYIKNIITSEFPLKIKIQLLAGQDHNKVPCLTTAILNNHNDLASSYIDTIFKAGLIDEFCHHLRTCSLSVVCFERINEHISAYNSQLMPNISVR